MKYKQLKKILCRHERKHPGTHLTACITFWSFGPPSKKYHPLYSWEGRTYLISSGNKAFQPGKGNRSIYGSCLDNISGPKIRLDTFMTDEYGGKGGWVVEDCGIAGYLLIECNDCNIPTTELFYSYDGALDRMLSRLAEVGERDAEQMKKDFAVTKELFEEDCYRVSRDSAWLADPCMDWRWSIQPVCIYDPLKLVFPNLEGRPCSVQVEQQAASDIQSSGQGACTAMKLDQFNQMAVGDPLTLLAALELLLQNGRSMIQSRQAPELVAGCQSSLGALFTEGKLCEIVDVCQRLAGLETKALVDYIHRGSLKIKDPGADEEGICPICGGELEYGDDEPLDDGGVYEWTCPSCGATGKEGYNKVFDQHYEVYDGDGNPYPAPPQ